MIDLSLYSDVFCILDKEEKYSALEEVISSCSIFSLLPEEIDKFKASVIRRERKLSTDIGHGVAIAHGKVPHLEKTVIALGYSEKGIQFKEDSTLVHLVFVIASPPNGSDYIVSISSILSWVHDLEFRDELSSCELTDNVKAFFDMLKKQSFFSFDLKS